MLFCGGSLRFSMIIVMVFDKSPPEVGESNNQLVLPVIRGLVAVVFNSF